MGNNVYTEKEEIGGVMRKLLYRLKMLIKRHKDFSWSLVYMLTMMDFGRWIFKKARLCNTCGSLNVVGYGPQGLYCHDCQERACKHKEESCQIK